MPRLDPATVRGLIERVREAKGPDREIDYDIWATVDPDGIASTARTECLALPWPRWREVHAQDRFNGDNHRPVTASLDAALALALAADPEAEKMPAGEWLENAIRTLNASGDAFLQGSDPVGRIARALLFCLLSDILAQAEADDGGQHGG